MNPAETHEITQLIGRLRDEAGYTILVIEHDMRVVKGISDRVVALDHGSKIAEGSYERGGDRRARRRGVPGHEGGGRRGDAVPLARAARSTPTTGRSTSCRTSTSRSPG